MHTQPNKLKSDDDTSFQMCIRGISRADWNLAITTIRKWADAQPDSNLPDTKKVLNVLRNMQALIDGGSDSFEIRISPGVVNCKLTKTKLAILRKKYPSLP